MIGEDKLNYSDLLMIVNEKILAPIDMKISRQLKDHLLQRICQPFYFLLNYDEDVMTYTKKNYNLDKIIDKSNLRHKNQSLHLSYFQEVKLLSTFFMYFTFAVIYIFFAKKLKPCHKLNLVYGMAQEQIYLNSKEIYCVDFFKEMNPLWKEADTQILIELRKPLLFFEKSKINFRVIFDIFLYMQRYKSINRFKIISKLFMGLFSVVKLSRKNSVILLIGKEILYEYISNSEFPKIESLSTTVSQVLVQPYLFHLLPDTPKLMYWYSNNSKTFFNKELNSIEGDQSFVKYAKIDKHYVWTEDFGNLIKKISGKEFNVFDYILFYNQTSNYQTKKIGILIFDITPHTIYNDISFYSEKNSIKFIEDIVEVYNIIDDKYSIGPLTLKPKRAYSKLHSQSYISRIRVLNKSGFINSEDSNVNLLDLIPQAKIVISMPFSSTSLISHRLGVPSCFYNPDIDYNLDKIVDGIEVIDSKENLMLFCKTALGY
jgi:polysaccharide biosynthesis PFTS motif protein